MKLNLERGAGDNGFGAAMAVVLTIVVIALEAITAAEAAPPAPSPRLIGAGFAPLPDHVLGALAAPTVSRESVDKILRRGPRR